MPDEPSPPDPRRRRRRRRVRTLIALAAVAVTAFGFGTAAQASPRAAAARSTASVTEVTLGALAFAGRGSDTSVVVGNGGSVVVAGDWSSRWWGEESAPHVVLQRRIGTGRWTTTPASVAVTDHGMIARTPAFATRATKRTIAYRLVSRAYSDPATGGVRTTSMSASVRVRYENQARYTGLAASLYRVVKPYCRTTAIHIGALPGDRAGEYETGALLLRVVPGVADYRAIDRRAVALHECSHERQWVAYGGTSEGRRTMLAAAKARFSDWTKPAGATTPYPYDEPASTITPVEHAADCGAQAVNPGGYLGYGGWCSPAQLDAGRRLLLGHRY